MSDAARDALCRLCGIEPTYHDIWGKAHEVAPETVAALARTMGVDLRRGIEAAVSELEQRPWRRPLDPVLVARENESPPEIRVRLPVSAADRDLAWTLTLENGERLHGKLQPAALAAEPGPELDGTRYAAYRLPLPRRLPLGYHDFQLSAPSESRCRLIVAPGECYLPAAVANAERVWGPALQLYTLRSRRNWGIGDFTDLRAAVERFAEHGAAVVGLNPLHALYPHNPGHISPYSPSSRLFLNVLYIDVEAIPEYAQCEAAQQLVQSRAFQDRLEKLRAAELVDYLGVGGAKFAVLEMLFQYFRARHLASDSERARAFRTFQTRGGALLARQALYEALQEHFHRNDASIWGWPAWPEPYRDPAARAVVEFAERERTRIEFYQYLQWHAHLQLQAAGRRAADLGMGVGLYQDLAVSVDRGGAETWSLQSLYAAQASIGAPPDELALQGQDWGLPPLVPRRLTEAAYEPFIATLRENMRNAGALRIDHVMGLMRLFWVPPGRTARDGAYVRYPFDDLLGILALESQRNRCLVIGEDLGTVPDEVRARLAPMKVLSYRLFYFERESNGEYKAPAAYPALALAAVTTHDLPTLAGYWKGEDLRERERLALFPSEATRRQQILARTQDRMRLLAALQREALLPAGVTIDPASIPEMTPALARAIHSYLARTPAKVMMFQPEDAVGESRQVNFPGTTDAYPNWRRKLTLDLDDLMRDARMRGLLEALREARGTGVAAGRTRPPERRAVIPDATYRMQFHRDFTFAYATALVPYLHRLGISHCYASPYLKARPGSRHGYDIVDHNALNPEIGSAADFERFVAALHAHGMGQILDIVPNHMGVGSDNAWWLDVLENGRASVYAGFFDIDWRPLKAELRGKVLLPVLGQPYGGALQAAELRLEFDRGRGAIAVRYYDHCFPIDPGTYPQILERDLPRLEQALGRDHARVLEFQTLIAALRHLPGRDEMSDAKRSERHRDKEVHKRRLAELCALEPMIGRYLEEVVADYNGANGAAPRHDQLHALLEQQAYRLAYWRVASDEINYRRFFDINDLAAVRQENPQAFVATHRLISELVAGGKVNGLRIDHPDGLYNPVEYYQRLQGFVMAAVQGEAATGAAAAPTAESLYVVTEKILAAHERLPDDWPVHGTTGYDFANLVSGLLVYPGGERELNRLYARFIGRTLDFDELLSERKRLIMRVALSSELNVLANHLNRISESDWHARDHTLIALREALRDVITYFPVYRTYVRSDRVTAEDRRYVEWAVAQAKRHSPAADVSVYDFVREVLLLERLDERDADYRRAVLDFAMRFQQYTAPVMAKGLEDTSFYIYNRLVSLNDVGGDPRHFGVSIAAFHYANQERAQRWPHAMLATSSHDSKRSEDVRARIDVLSELATEWRGHVLGWARINRSKRRVVEGQPAPARNDEYLFYQTLVGAWPLERLDAAARAAVCERVEAYMLKAVREAKVHTSWINPNAEYEAAVSGFVRAALASGRNLFLEDFLPFQRRIARFGLLNGLSQVLLKLTAPGMPDIYQGNELWDFSLVDPDNRRAVDYRRREAMLAELEAEMPADDERAVWARGLFETLEDGRAKLYVTWRTLTLRRGRAQAFREGTYVALNVEGRYAEHLCAYARRYGDWAALVVVPRWYARLGADLPTGSVWRETWVEAPPDDGTRPWRNVLTGERVAVQVRNGRRGFAVAELLASTPLGLFEA